MKAAACMMVSGMYAKISSSRFVVNVSKEPAAQIFSDIKRLYLVYIKTLSGVKTYLLKNL